MCEGVYTILAHVIRANETVYDRAAGTYEQRQVGLSLYKIQSNIIKEALFSGGKEGFTICLLNDSYTQSLVHIFYGLDMISNS